VSKKLFRIDGSCARQAAGLDKEDKKLLGLAPRRSKEGDRICIICVPVILKEISSQDEVYFNFVGEAYTHGIMDGEELSGYLSLRHWGNGFSGGKLNESKAWLCSDIGRGA
jgi:hypothetical protein